MKRNMFQKIKNLPELDGALIRTHNQKERNILRNVLIKLQWMWSGNLSCKTFFPKNMVALQLGWGRRRGTIHSYRVMPCSTPLYDDKVYTVQQFLRLVRDAQAEVIKLF